MFAPVDTSLPEHFKLKRLARRLGISKPTATGHLVWLWCYAMKVLDDGDLSPLSAEDIAEIAGWEGDADQFLDAMLAIGFIDQTPGGLVLHDWQDYGGKMIEARQAAAERQARHRKRKARPAPMLRNGDVTVTSPLRNALEKNREEESRKEEEDSRIDAPTGAQSSASAFPFPAPIQQAALRYDNTDAEQRTAILTETTSSHEQLAVYFREMNQAERLDDIPGHAYLLSYDASMMHDAATRWRAIVRRRANPAELAVFARLIQDPYDTETLLPKAIDEAATATDRPNIRYVEAIYERMATQPDADRSNGHHPEPTRMKDYGRSMAEAVADP